MASTITAADLTVTLTESIILDETDYGLTNILIVEDVTEVYRRIVTVTTSSTAVLSFAAAVSAGSFVRGDVKYVRVTNKDDTNYVELVINGASNNSCCFKLEAGKSFLLGIGTSSVDANDSAAITSASFVNLSGITAKANTASVDLELFVAGT